LSLSVRGMAPLAEVPSLVSCPVAVAFAVAFSFVIVFAVAVVIVFLCRGRCLRAALRPALSLAKDDDGVRR